jgi:DMSO/TMAO reductase YedYZ molybdopterin-dependent catalytic subunit
MPEDPEIIVSPDTRREERLPPGQSETHKWPVLDASGPPVIDLRRWRLRLSGLVARPVEWDWDEFQKLPRIKVFADFHCVTRWSRLGNTWEGVSTRELLERAGARCPPPAMRSRTAKTRAGPPTCLSRPSSPKTLWLR